MLERDAAWDEPETVTELILATASGRAPTAARVA